MTILPLDTNTAKLITTTQIITSVSSAAKELIENALDAGAKNIEINLVFHYSLHIEEYLFRLNYPDAFVLIFRQIMDVP